MQATYVIAEMACSHDGNPELARRIVDAAGRAGAHAVQFQIWRLEDLMAPTNAAFERVKRLEMTREQWRDLAQWTRKEHPGLDLIACVYDCNAIAFAEEIGVDAYKIHSGDVTNPVVLDRVAATGKRVDLSVGGSTLDEITAALGIVRRAGAPAPWLMYGLQSFPTPLDAVHLRYLSTLRTLYGLTVGYQDHTDPASPAAFHACAAAVGMGVPVLEKHITHDRSLRGADHEAALNPAEFTAFMAMVRDLDTVMGNPHPRPLTDQEIGYRRLSRKSIVAARPLPEGTVLTADDLAFLRVDEMGLAPAEFDKVVGRSLRRPLAAYDRVLPEHLS